MTLNAFESRLGIHSQRRQFVNVDNEHSEHYILQIAYAKQKKIDFVYQHKKASNFCLFHIMKIDVNVCVPFLVSHNRTQDALCAIFHFASRIDMQKIDRKPKM